MAWRGARAHPDAPTSPAAGAPVSQAGLGLAIVKGIVEAHDGVVDVVDVGGADEAGEPPPGAASGSGCRGA